MRNYFIGIALAILTSYCNNVGFVDKAKSVTGNEFGVEIFAMSGSVSTGAFLNAGDATLSSTCSAQSGIAKANCNCESEASARGFKGTYKAWISINGTVDAICNVQGIIGTNCSASSQIGPFLVNKTGGYQVLASDFAELSTTGLRSAIQGSAKPVFTGTGADGRASGSDCAGFTITGAFATAGDASSAGAGYTTGAMRDCSAVGAGASHLCMKLAK